MIPSTATAPIALSIAIWRQPTRRCVQLGRLCPRPISGPIAKHAINLPSRAWERETLIATAYVWQYVVLEYSSTRVPVWCMGLTCCNLQLTFVAVNNNLRAQQVPADFTKV